MKQSHSKKEHGLVLTGGGARAAYQAGVLRAIAEITGAKESPFSIISGYSAGAINGAAIASHKGSFAEATQNLWDLWSSLSVEQIFNVDALSLGKIAAQWIKDRSFGGVFNQQKQITYLLDTAPLGRFLQEKIDFDSLNHNVENGTFRAVSFSATDYRSGHSVAFYNGDPNLKDWQALNRISVRTRLTADHIMASSAIPIFFPPVNIGNSFYGDGMIRLNSPLSSAVHLGSQKLLVIGIRGPSSTSQTAAPVGKSISVGEIVGTILNGLFFDSLDGDMDRMTRINKALEEMDPTERERVTRVNRLREIPFLSLTPSHELASVPECSMSRMPLTLNVLLKGIGVSGGRGSDLLSYLAFEPTYLKSLLSAGYEDTKARKEQIIEFFGK